MPGFTTRVAGVSFRQQEISECIEGDDVELVREPDNRHDSNAIRVDSDYGQIGYIPSETAVSLAPKMDRGNAVHAYIEAITGGTDDKPTMGVVLNVSTNDWGEDLTDAEDDSTFEDVMEKGFLGLIIVAGLLTLVALFIHC